MVSLEQIRRDVFSESLGYINMPANIIDLVDQEIENASDAKLLNVQQQIGISQQQLVMGWNLIEQENIDQQFITNFLFPIATHLMNIFYNNNLERNLLTDFQGEGIKPKKTRFVKGSQEAKDYMASIRAKKGKTSK